jgi:oxalate decarboxylase/phosphoglucose isomerase-like protein (cupin superfamily)
MKTMAINGVIFQSRGIDHEDIRRTISTAFNGDFGDFFARQVKTYRVHQDAQLAGHFHKYSELFYVIEGEINFLLVDTRTGEKEEYSLKKGCSLLVPAYIAHKVFVKEGTLFIGCSAERFISNELNDNKYDF